MNHHQKASQKRTSMQIIFLACLLLAQAGAHPLLATEGKFFTQPTAHAKEYAAYKTALKKLQSPVSWGDVIDTTDITNHQILKHQSTFKYMYYMIVMAYIVDHNSIKIGLFAPALQGISEQKIILTLTCNQLNQLKIEKNFAVANGLSKDRQSLMLGASYNYIKSDTCGQVIGFGEYTTAAEPQDIKKKKGLRLLLVILDAIHYHQWPGNPYQDMITVKQVLLPTKEESLEVVDKHMTTKKSVDIGPTLVFGTDYQENLVKIAADIFEAMQIGNTCQPPQGTFKNAFAIHCRDHHFKITKQVIIPQGFEDQQVYMKEYDKKKAL
jgi:hypothetical protein